MLKLVRATWSPKRDVERFLENSTSLSQARTLLTSPFWFTPGCSLLYLLTKVWPISCCGRRDALLPLRFGNERTWVYSYSRGVAFWDECRKLGMWRNSAYIMRMFREAVRILSSNIPQLQRSVKGRHIYSQSFILWRGRPMWWGIASRSDLVWDSGLPTVTWVGLEVGSSSSLSQGQKLQERPYPRPPHQPPPPAKLFPAADLAKLNIRKMFAVLACQDLG